MELKIGSNVIRNTNGILEVQGEEQIVLEIRDDGQLLLTMDIYDINRNHVAKLRRNAWVFNNEERFDITTNPKSLKLVDKDSKETVVEVNIIGVSAIQIPQGTFYTHKGDLILVTPQHMKIKGITMIENIIDGMNMAIDIREGSIGIGRGRAKS